MNRVLISAVIGTPLGDMMAVSDEEELYVLGFTDQKNLFRHLRHGTIIEGRAAPLDLIRQELADYFQGALWHFTVPLRREGTPFQKRVWEKLCEIPYGTTMSYAELAAQAGNPLACRAAGSANGANPLALVVPCHRVINKGGGIGGYASGIQRKKALLDLEKKSKIAR